MEQVTQPAYSNLTAHCILEISQWAGAAGSFNRLSLNGGSLIPSVRPPWRLGARRAFVCTGDSADRDAERAHEFGSRRDANKPPVTHNRESLDATFPDQPACRPRLAARQP
jgi:hypothetical protein